MTDTFKMLLSYYDMQCTSASVSGPVFSISTCVRMHTIVGMLLQNHSSLPEGFPS